MAEETTLNDWKKLQRILKDQYDEFLLEYPKKEGGRNKDIRNKAAARVDNCIYLSKTWVMKYPEAYKMVIGEGGPIHVAEAWDDFGKSWYFGREIEKLLKKIQEKIETMEQEDSDSET